MESLYTKYRPQTFADVVGQSHVVTTLERAVLEGRTSHAYLFCGPRGTGKTTMARLLAKALMCEQGEGHLPDGTCEQCRLIAAGEHPDVYELDAASRTGVDNVREEIISRVSFAPARSAYKMYIIDEVHMLTTAAFNALLKTLEEPPSHVVFVLCTTDPQKIPETILSRVQRFDFHAISNADIQQRLAYICDREGFSYDDEALELVVRHARGGMRDAISELEQLSVSGGGAITVDVARDVLGEVSASTLERMSMAMANRDVPTLFAQIESLVEVGRDLLQFTRAMAARLRDVYVVAAVGATSNVIAASDDELPAISREARAFGSVDRIARALALLSDASTEMRVAPNQRLVLEVALTKIARPQSELTLDALADRIATLERQIVALSVPAARQDTGARPPAPEREPKDHTPVTPVQEAVPVRDQRRRAQAAEEAQTPLVTSSADQREVPARPSAQQQPMQGRQRPMQDRRPVAAQRPQQAESRQPQSYPAQPQVTNRADAGVTQHQATPAARQAAPQNAAPKAQGESPAVATAAITDPGELQRKWKQVVDGLLASHPQHGSLLMNSTIASDDGETLTVTFPKGSTFACKMLERADVRANVDPAVAAAFGHRKARFVNGASDPSAPKPHYAAAKQAAAPSQARPAQQVARQPVQTPSPQPMQAPPQQPVQAPPQQPAQTQPAPQPSAQATPGPAFQTSVPQQPAYAAPWEPEPAYDDDVVPYDDFDTSPYEEEYAFDPVLASQQSASPTSRVVAAATVQPPARAHVEQVAPVPAQVPYASRQQSPETPAPSVPVVQEAARETPQDFPQTKQPAPQAVTQDFGLQEAASPAQPAASSRQEPQPEPEVPAKAKTDEAPALPEATSAGAVPKPKSKRASRKVAGIPADIVTMMTEIFGEGITYTQEPPEEEDDLTIEDEVDPDDIESEYLEEPTDDADYDEED